MCASICARVVRPKQQRNELCVCVCDMVICTPKRSCAQTTSETPTNYSSVCGVRGVWRPNNKYAITFTERPAIECGVVCRLRVSHSLIVALLPSVLTMAPKTRRKRQRRRRCRRRRYAVFIPHKAAHNRRTLAPKLAHLTHMHDAMTARSVDTFRTIFGCKKQRRKLMRTRIKQHTRR